MLAEQGGITAPLTNDAALLAARFEWPHRDPFDRMLAATALEHDLFLISKDRAFSTLPGLRVIW